MNSRLIPEDQVMDFTYEMESDLIAYYDQIAYEEQWLYEQYDEELYLRQKDLEHFYACFGF